MNNGPHRSALRLLIPIALALLPAMNTDAASDQIVFDFQTATNSAWQIINDDVMGGVSRSGFRLTNGLAVFEGQVSLENNGGFASVRSLPVRSELAGCNAFVVLVRGDGQRYKLTIRTERSFDGALYQAAFTTKKGKWEEHRLPLKQFIATFRGRVLAGEPPLDPAKITSVGFLISDKQEGPFQLEVAWIKARIAALP
jgi:NADH dehydrogenase [ubiquinone] 1 alpha subcomplex assembly factor 1